MPGQTHIIGREIISLTYQGPKSEAASLHQEMSEMFRNKLIRELEEVLNREVDVVPARSLKPALAARVLAEAIAL